MSQDPEDHLVVDAVSAYYAYWRSQMIAESGVSEPPPWEALSGEACMAWMTAYSSLVALSASMARAVALTLE